MKKHKVIVKRTKKTKKKTAVKRKRVIRRSSLPRDPFVLNPKEMRPKRTYQWVTVKVMGVQYDTDLDRMLDAGWNPALRRNFSSLRRHWDKKAGGIVVGGQMLMERSAKLTKEAREADIAAANALLPKQRLEVGQYEYAAGVAPISAPVVGDGRWLDHLGAAKARIKELGGAVPVNIRLALTDREIEAAAICHLTVDQYAQRKIEMGLAEVLAITDPVFKSGIYRPVELQVAIKKE